MYNNIENCRSMVVSVLAYGGFGSTPERILDGYQGKYLDGYVEALGRDVVLGVLKETIDRIETIDHNVYTDGEGCSYNSIKWKVEGK